MAARHRAKRRSAPGNERGAVAVEFALILPIFLILILGILEFGRAFNIQISLSEAARESARYTAVHHGDPGFSIAAAQNVGVAAAPSVPLSTGNIKITYSSGSACATGINVISTVTYPTGFVSGLEKLLGLTQAFTVKGVGVMRCGG